MSKTGEKPMTIELNSPETGASGDIYKIQHTHQLVDNAVAAAAYLIDKFADSLEFHMWVKTPTLERWMQESYPEVVKKLQAESVYEEFRAKLNAYRERLADAALKVAPVEDYGSDDMLEYSDAASHRILSGLVALISSSHARELDERAMLQALLVDKHCRAKRRAFDYPVLNVARHTDVIIRKTTWGFCDVSAVEANTNDDVVYLLAREHFPPDLASKTEEEFALVVRIHADTDQLKLVAPRHMGSVNVATVADFPERSITFSSLPFCIPMLENEKILELFRNHLPVLYFHGETGLLVEYPWNPVTDFAEFLMPYADWDTPADWVDHSCDLTDFKANHPQSIRISEIRPMPLMMGPYLSKNQRFQLDSFDDEIPF